MNRPAPSVSVRYTRPTLFSSFTCAAPTGTLFSSTTEPAQSAESAACISAEARRLIVTNTTANRRVEAMGEPLQPVPLSLIYIFDIENYPPPKRGSTGFLYRSEEH